MKKTIENGTQRVSSMTGIVWTVMHNYELGGVGYVCVSSVNKGEVTQCSFEIAEFLSCTVPLV